MPTTEDRAPITPLRANPRPHQGGSTLTGQNRPKRRRQTRQWRAANRWQRASRCVPLTIQVIIACEKPFSWQAGVNIRYNFRLHAEDSLKKW